MVATTTSTSSAACSGWPWPGRPKEPQSASPTTWPPVSSTDSDRSPSHAPPSSPDVLADLLTEVIAIVVLVITGLAVGWGIHNGVGDALLAFGLCLLIAFAMTWVGACAGMLVKNPEAAQAAGFIFFLPLVFVSNTFVPTQGMPRLASRRCKLEPGERCRLGLSRPLR